MEKNLTHLFFDFYCFSSAMEDEALPIAVIVQ